ncbi:MAG: hypothetical protein RIE58_11890 [Vicingaceae bacterium]
MSTFIEKENNRINYKHGTYQKISAEIGDWTAYLEHTWKFFERDKLNFLSWLKENPIDSKVADDRNWKLSLEENISLRNPHKHLTSVFTNLYRISEHELGSFCHFYQLHYNIELSSEITRKIDLNKDNFYWLKALLKKQKHEMLRLDPEYQRILQFKKIRDNLSHRPEHTLISKPKDQTFRKFLEDADGIELTDSYWVQEGGLHGFYFSSDVSIMNLSENIQVFFKKLLDLTYPSSRSQLIE